MLYLPGHAAEEVKQFSSASRQRWKQPDPVRLPDCFKV